MGSLRAQGEDVDLPSLSDVRDEFDRWLIEDDRGEVTADDTLMKRVLGLSGGG